MNTLSGVVTMKRCRNGGIQAFRNPSAPPLLAVLLALASHGAPAQTPQAGASSLLEEVIVTGTRPEGRTALETSYGVAVIDADTMRQEAPLGINDLLDAVPGLWAESWGGEANNSLSARGTRPGFNTFISLQEDGLPIAYSPFLSEFEIRQDLTYERIETVLGGPSGVFTAQGAAATVNFISRKPHQQEGEVRLMLTDYGNTRLDAFYGGPLAGLEAWRFAVGGYFRSGNGIRQVDYRADHGGQLRLLLSRDIDSGRGDLTLSLKRINDNTAFYTWAPVRFAGGRPALIPGFDPRRDALNGPDNRFMDLKTPSGEVRRIDLQDGVKIRSDQYSLYFDYQFNSGWRVENRARIMRSFSDNVDLRGGGGGSSRFTRAADFMRRQLPVLQAAFPTVRSTQLVRLQDGAVIADPAGLNGNGLLVTQDLISYQRDIDNFFNNFKLTWANEAFSIATGVQYFDARQEIDYYFGQFLLDVRPQARRYDLLGLDARGQVAGRLAGDSGVLTHFNLDNGGTLEHRSINPYLNVEYQLTENLRLDAGLRYEDATFRASGEDVRSGVPIAGALNDPQVLADNSAAVFRNGDVYTGRSRVDDLTWTLGANYTLNERLAVYARYADAHDFGFTALDFAYFNVPGFGAAAGSNLGLTDKAAKLEFVEAGIRLRGAWLDVFATGFFTRNKALAVRTQEVSGVLREIRVDNEVLGLEFQGVLRPTEWLSVEFSGVLQDSKIADNDPSAASQDGNRLDRLPNEQIRIAPKWHFGRGYAYLSAQYYGDRFGDLDNTVTLPAYTQIDMGVFYDLTGRISLSLQGNNLNDVKAFLTCNGDAACEPVFSRAEGAYGFSGMMPGRNFVASLSYRF